MQLSGTKLCLKQLDNDVLNQPNPKNAATLSKIYSFQGRQCTFQQDNAKLHTVPHL